MKILLIAPPRFPGAQPSSVGATNRRAVGALLPLSLLSLAAALRRAGHAPRVLDLSTEPDLTTDSLQDVPLVVQESIAAFPPALVAVTCMTSMHFPAVNRLTRSLRERYPQLPIVLGGVHPSLFPGEILEHCPPIDYVVVGEGEEQLCQLADALTRDPQADLSHIQSFAWRRGAAAVVQPRVSYIECLDDLPDPAWDLIRLGDYHTDLVGWNNPKGLAFKLAVPIASSRSCPFSCNFCAAQATMGRKLRRRSPSRVVDEMQALYEKCGETYFSFVDDNINADKRHVLALCAEIVGRGLDIQFETLSGLHVANLDDEVVAALADAGCVFVRLAIEHGNDRIRNQVIGKHLSRSQIDLACAALKKRTSIRTCSMFIMGFPEDTCETLEDTRRMILDLQLDLNYVFNLVPFPGTRVFAQALRDGLLLREFDIGRLWAGEIGLDLTQGTSPFFIRPYRMTVAELASYREIFDRLRVLSPATAANQRNHDEREIRDAVI